jgi:hypothetical protein
MRYVVDACWPRAAFAPFALVLLLGGCWADFPDSRFNQDHPSSIDTHVTKNDGQATVPEAGSDTTGIGGERASDHRLADHRHRDHHLYDRSLVDSAKVDGGTVDVGVPDKTTTTPDKAVVPDLPVTIDLKVCTDSDGDKYTDCAGDCNDKDPLVNPGQTSYQTAASSASYDYNCDGKETQEYPSLVNCQLVGPTCSGDGWSGTVPACGATGSFQTCSTASCVAQAATTKVQGCL